MHSLPLSLRRYGKPGKTPLILLHGLFGSGINWHGIAARLADDREVLVPDLRNHGASPQDPVMDYPGMAADLLALMNREGIERAAVTGHSMGGKAAMTLALTQPERVESLCVVDIAPIAYPGGFESMIDALQALPIQRIEDRDEAHRHLSAAIPDAAVRDYLLANLRRDEHRWRWRLNLDGIAAAMPAITGFPRREGRQFAGPTLFLYGSDSNYVGARTLGAIRSHFPLARLRAVANAGHWVYADQPDVFVAALKRFLG